MGCDIHMYVEAKGGPYNRWHRVTRKLELSPEWRKNTVYSLGWGEGRNYDAFAMLADVRNGTGFAGIDTGDGFEPIDQPRGLPADASLEVVEAADNWGEDGHSHSFFTLRELVDLEHLGYWDKTTTIRGMVHRDELEVIEKNGLVKSINGNDVELRSAPRTWSGDIHGPDPKDLFRISWQQTYRKSAGWLVSTTIPALIELATSWEFTGFFHEGVRVSQGDRSIYPTLFNGVDEPLAHWVDTGELVRIVLWFDN